MKTTLCSALYLALIGAGALVAQPAYFTQMTEGPIVNDALDTWYGYWGDYDNDGRLDLHVNGNAGQWRVYHNDGGATFSTVTSGPLGDYANSSLWGLWCDPDNDGDLDLFGWTRPSNLNAMFWNDGTGGFTRDDSWLQGTDAHSVGAILALGDFDGDGFIDAFLCAVDSDDRNAQLHNNGDGTFAVVADSVLNILGDNTIQSACAVDYDNDGDLDIVIVRWGGQPTRLYRNDGRGSFMEATPEPSRSEVTFNLSAAWGDIDNDGDLDVIFGGTAGLSEHVYINSGDGTFTPWSGTPALFESYDNQLGSCPAWGDFDNDGYLDLVVSKASSPIRLWRNQGDGSFTEVFEDSVTGVSGSFDQSAEWVDIDQDGNLDLFVLTLNKGKDKLFMGNGNGNHWLEVKPKGTVSNRLAIGARIFATATFRGQVMRQMRVITANTTDQTMVAHIGLGDAAQVDLLRIEWPSGIVQELTDVAPNQILTVTEHQADATIAPSLTLSTPAPGPVQLMATGQTNLRYVFEASSDLSQWTKIAVRTNLTGAVDYTPPASSSPQRFYRVQVP